MQDFVRQAVILAGGRGERLRPLTDSMPKPMAPVLDKPFLDYLLYSLAEAGIQKVLLLVGYRHEQIVARYRNCQQIQVEFSIGREEDETLQRVLQAKDKLDDTFLLLYGDNYWPLEFQQMLDFYRLNHCICTTTVFGNQNGTGEYGRENNVEVGSDGLVIRYDKQRAAPGLNGVDIGFFILKKSVLEAEFGENPSMERALLPRLVSRKELKAFVTQRQYYYITSIESLKEFEVFARKQKLKVIGEK